MLTKGINVTTCNHRILHGLRLPITITYLDTRSSVNQTFNAVRAALGLNGEENTGVVNYTIFVKLR